MKKPIDICPESEHDSIPMTRPSRPGIYPSTAYVCDNPELANAILAGESPGYAYQRDGHPNSDMLGNKCAKLHHHPSLNEDVLGTVTSSGMAALTLALVAYLKSGDHVLLSNRLYGKTTSLVAGQLSRFGIESGEADCCDLVEFEAAVRDNTKMIIVETISNPQMRVADIESISKIAKANDALLLVDNTFATPIVCQPLKHGADLVLESLSKFMNGHGDLMLGFLCGRKSIWQGLDGLGLNAISSTWGLASAPFDCWLAERGVATLAVRMLHASRTAESVAKFLEQHPAVRTTNYPGSPSHLDREISLRQFELVGERTCFANLLSFDLQQIEWAERLIRNVEIPFCPSLGEAATTLSHPGSTSHRTLNEQQLAALAISHGTIRLSIGLESAETLISQLKLGLDGLDS